MGGLLRVTDNIYRGFNNHNKLTGPFVDDKTAFDVVDHNILLSKLEAVGIRAVALSWFSGSKELKFQSNILHHFVLKREFLMAQCYQRHFFYIC